MQMVEVEFEISGDMTLEEMMTGTVKTKKTLEDPDWMAHHDGFVPVIVTYGPEYGKARVLGYRLSSRDFFVAFNFIESPTAILMLTPPEILKHMRFDEKYRAWDKKLYARLIDQVMDDGGCYPCTIVCVRRENGEAIGHVCEDTIGKGPRFYPLSEKSVELFKQLLNSAKKRKRGGG